MKHTPLYPVYRNEPGIQLTEFGGWELPLHFSTGILAEHEAVRTAAGLFDVSHMGECLVEGPLARRYVDFLCTNRIDTIVSGQAMYTLMCYPNGTVVDDILVYCLADDRFLLILNATNCEKDLAWIQTENPWTGERPAIVDRSEETVQLALQGPEAATILAGLCPSSESLAPFRFLEDCDVGGILALVSRTGYTGEDGFELYCKAEDGPALWKKLREAGTPGSPAPCGLGARDTLRIEAKLPLYGHEISDTITPLEANLGVFVALDKTDFCGRDALVRQRDEGVPRSLRGIRMIDKAVPRTGYAVFLEDRKIGYVTSGTKSPTLGIFCAYVLVERHLGLKFGDEVMVEVRGKRKRAVLVKTPFYRREKRTE